MLGKTYQAVDRAATQAAFLQQQQPLLNTSEEIPVSADGVGQSDENANRMADKPGTVHPLQEIAVLAANHAWLVWLVVALVLLVRKITIYQGFMGYMNAASTPVSDIEMLNRLSVAAGRAGIKKPIDLCVNPLVSSPLLTGLFHPCIVLPGVDVSEKDFQYIILHELTHYKRRDMFYKWLVQVTVCLHWFNPLVHLMGREITRACEFSCDEAVLDGMGGDDAQDYGKTLLDAMAAVGKYRDNIGAVTLSENKQLLKERIGAIMKFKERTKGVKVLTAILTACVILGASFVGVYAMETTVDKAYAAARLDTSLDSVGRNMGVPTDAPDSQRESNQPGKRKASYEEVEKYYEADSLPLFERSFPRLDESAQEAWLEKVYADDDAAFFSAAVRGLDADSPLIDSFAKKAYVDEKIAFFSILTEGMDEAELESWLDKALEDGRWDFQSLLFDRLDRCGEFDELKEKEEKEWEERQKEEYRAVGVTMDGKDYYYQGQLVNIFLDIRANKSFYTLDMNPEGVVNIKIIRDENDKVTDAAYMTEAEVEELFGDMG